MTDQEPDRGKRKRPYRQRVICGVCKKELDSDYKDNHAKTVHKGRKVAFTMVRERNQSQLAFFTKSSAESRPSQKLFRSDNQTDAHDQDNTGSCSNVQTDGIEKVEISPVSVVLELQDDQDEHVPIQEATEEPQPFSPQTLEVAMEPEVEMTVPLQRDDNAVRESGLATSEGPQQSTLREYNPQRFGNETFTRDFQPKWFTQYPWLNYSVDGKVATCYACSTFLKDNAFTFSNWKKPERLTKHHQSDAHSLAMTKWLEYREMERKSSSIISIIDDGHRKYVQRNREFLRVIIKCLFYTAQQNIAQRGHEEDRSNLEQRSDVNRGKLEIFADLIIELICEDVRDSGWYGIIIDETSDLSRAEQVSFCLSYIANGSKKEAFVGFHATKTTDGETLYQLVKDVINKLQLELQNIVGECFDGAINMSGVNKGLSARMKECSPLAIYVPCYGHLLNLALQDTMTTVEPLRNTLGTIQSLYNFLEASPKRHALFGDIETEEGSLLKTDIEVSKCNKMGMSVGSGESRRPAARANSEGIVSIIHRQGH